MARYSTKFKDVYWFYANIMDYIRVFLNFLAGLLIYFECNFYVGLLLIISVWMDDFDGPVARYYKQGSCFGSGIDWFADIQSEVMYGIWLVSLSRNLIPFFVVTASIELSTCVYDYAATLSIYPLIASKQNHWFFKVLEWATPGSNYTFLGRYCWLSYMFFKTFLGWTLSFPEKSLFTSIVLNSLVLLLLFPSIFYLWNELAQLGVLIDHFREPSLRDRNPKQPAKYDDGVFSYEGMMNENLKSLVLETLDILKKEQKFIDSSNEREVFWFELCPSILPKDMEFLNYIRGKLPNFEKLRKEVELLVAKCYENCLYNIDGIGFICNPVNSRAQSFHLDYNADYSSLFMPIENANINNQTSYLVFPSLHNEDIFETIKSQNDKVDYEKIIEEYGFVSHRQLLAKPFSVLRMNFGSVHRGMTNLGDKLRITFYVSITRNGAKSVCEDSVQDFTVDKSVNSMMNKKMK
jgi:phosphatidylglycerophosphate synthase